MAHTSTSDVIVPSVFSDYMQSLTEVKSKLVQSGLLVRNAELDALLRGGGLTFEAPGWDDLPDTAANVSLGATGSAVTPENVTAYQETMVRLSRNKPWGAVDLAGILAGSDPMNVIATRGSKYWDRELQRTVLAVLLGVFSDNTTNNSADMTYDGSNGGVYSVGVSTFSAEGFIDACHTAGDSEEDFTIVMMHSVVYGRAKKNNLIDFVSDSENPRAAKIPFFLGRRVVVDDGLPVTAGLYTTYIAGDGALQLGNAPVENPIEEYRLPLDAGGGGSTSIITRMQWIVHPKGIRWTGSAAVGGPSNASTSNNLGHVDSWTRVVNERKQVKLARYLTQESA